MVTNGSVLDRTRDRLHRESKFFRRLGAHRTDGAARLGTAVVATVHDAEAISAHVVRFFPQYTLHSETHLWNVLGWMEELAEPAIEQLGPLDCALAIQAAFVHDLGMVPSEDEYRDLGNPETAAGRAFQAFCDRHPLCGELERLRKLDKQNTPILESTQEDLLRGQMLADYLRTSHADERVAQGQNRILGWLNKFDAEAEYQGLPYRPYLALVAMSHGQPIDWLPGRLKHGPGGLDQRVNVHAHDYAGERVHWSQIGWLLRLADIMDFDATRTPKVVFEHLGIKNPISRAEWLKHLSVPVGPGTFADAAPLQYSVGCCPSPRIEKALLQYCQWINDEIRAVRDQREALDSKHWLPLKLPCRAEPAIATRERGYVYKDLEIRLDRDAIIDLLMGEALYGEPELALRELVQNALDALHVRDLRHRLSVELEGAPEMGQVGPVVRIGKSEKLAVEVKWGDADGRSFIKVRDNGVGMTQEAITRYLTQIGKSYYKSSDYNREKALMRRVLKGEDAELASMSPISQFGIGFLSCFMLADHITVHTRAAGESWRVEIDGPHGFIALYPDEAAPQPSGTEVTLWLKGELKLGRFDQEDLIRRLRKELFDINPKRTDGSREEVPAQGGIEPAFAIARYVLWPLYPVHLQPAEGARSEVILDSDMALLKSKILPLDRDAIRAKAIEWKVDPTLVGEPVWDPLTWRDVNGDGSGVRILVPRSLGVSKSSADWLRFSDAGSQRMPQWLLCRFTEEHLPEKRRTCVLVNGMRVPELEMATSFGHGVGALCFMDLRGGTAPKLRADRKATAGGDEPQHTSALNEFQQRAVSCLAPQTRDEARWRVYAVSGMSQPVAQDDTVLLIDPRKLHVSSELALSLVTAACLQELFRTGANTLRAPKVKQARRLALALGCVQAFGDTLGGDGKRKRIRDKMFDIGLLVSDHLEREGHLAGALLSLSGSISTHSVLIVDLVLGISRGAAALWRQDRPSTENALTGSRWRQLCRWHYFSEALCPDLGTCFAPLATGLAGTVGAKRLSGPLILGEPSTDADQSGPAWLGAYDLVAPVTAIPMNSLREKFPSWRDERAWRALLMLPFLLGEGPDEWDQQAERLVKTLGVEAIMLLMPDPRRFALRFSDGTKEDWAAGSASAIWNIREGTVLWAEGIHTRQSLLAQGKTLEALLPQKRAGGSGRKA